MFLPSILYLLPCLYTDDNENFVHKTFSRSFNKRRPNILATAKVTLYFEYQIIHKHQLSCGNTVYPYYLHLILYLLKRVYFIFFTEEGRNQKRQILTCLKVDDLWSVFIIDLHRFASVRITV